MVADTWGDLAVVLSGGGARAAYQVGVLSAIAERVPGIRIPIVTGVSAGAINATYLAAHRASMPRAVAELKGQWLRLTAEQVYSLPTRGVARSTVRFLARTMHRSDGAPAVRGLLDMRPLARFLGAAIEFSGIQDNIEDGRLRAVALSATSYATGQTVTFMQGAADVPVWRRAQRVAVRKEITVSHVMASSAIPIVFPAVKIAGGFYGDGSVRQTAPLAPAIHIGARRILVIGMRSGIPAGLVPRIRDTEYPTAAELAGLMLHSIFLDAIDADVERLERINRLLEALPAGVPAPDGLKPVKMAVVRPSRDLGELARGYRPHLPWAMRLLVNSMGGGAERGADFMSFLLFEPEYTGLLMELGHSDALADWANVERLLSEPVAERARSAL